MKLILNILLCILVGNISRAQQSYYVLFEYNKAVVPDTAMAFLIKTIYTNNVKQIYLEGHCDSIGSRGYNYALSERRVQAVEQLLVDNGFDRKKIEGKVGFGKDKPLAKNNSPEARQKNRRVLVRFSLGPSLAKSNIVVRKPITKKPEKIKGLTTEKVRLKVVKDDNAKEGSSFLRMSTASKSKKIIKQQKPAKPPKELKIENFTPNSTIALPNLLFQGGRHFLIKQSTPSLDTLLRILKAKPEIRIEIQGHVCCTTYHADGYDWDTRTDNLSVNRAKAIKAYLVKRGISSTRLKTKGFGGSKKLYPQEEDEFQRQQNRRVEVMVLPRQ